MIYLFNFMGSSWSVTKYNSSTFPLPPALKTHSASITHCHLHLCVDHEALCRQYTTTAGGKVPYSIFATSGASRESILLVREPVRLGSKFFWL